MTKKILAFAGSSREGAFSGSLIKAATAQAQALGADVTLVDLGALGAPIFDEDDERENGMPESIRDLKQKVVDHDAMMIATPEYNGFTTPLLVNTFAWLSRPGQDGDPQMVTHGKKVAIMASSPGGLGGVRVIPRLRDFLAESGMIVVNGFVTVPQAHSAFAEDGALSNERTAGQLNDLIQRLLNEI